MLKSNNVPRKLIFGLLCATALTEVAQAEGYKTNAVFNAVVETNIEKDSYQFPLANFILKQKRENCTVFGALKVHADSDFNYQETSIFGAGISCSFKNSVDMFLGRELPAKNTEIGRGVKNFVPHIEADREQELQAFLDGARVIKKWKQDFSVSAYAGWRTGFASPLPSSAPGMNTSSLSSIVTVAYDNKTTRLGVRYIYLSKNEESGKKYKNLQVFGSHRYKDFNFTAEHNSKKYPPNSYAMTATYDLASNWDVTAFKTNERYGLETRKFLSLDTGMGEIRAAIGGGISCPKDAECGPTAMVNIGYNFK